MRRIACRCIVSDESLFFRERFGEGEEKKEMKLLLLLYIFSIIAHFLYKIISILFLLLMKFGALVGKYTDGWSSDYDFYENLKFK